VSTAVLADTGPLYAAVNPDDQLHARARADVVSLLENDVTVLVPFPILCEAHSLVLRRLGTEVATTFLRDLLISALIAHPTGDDCVEAFRRAGDYADQKITLFDAVTAAMSDRLSQPVWTYDHHFDVMGAAVWR
jgi:predicted nucleic acid-binding protein